MTKTLKMAEGLLLPLDVVTQKIAFLGRTGGGKTYAATKLAELMLEAKAQIVALDPVGKWYGLRVGADGGEGFPVPVFGGLYGDVPLQPAAGALVADLVVDREISAVLDVSQFISSEQARFATDFARRLFERRKQKPAAMHLFVEECQEFVPQNLPPGGSGNAAMMLHQFERLIKLGRNYGVGASLISQRPQEVNKKVLNMTEIMFAFQMTGPQERKAVEAWVGDKGEDVGVVKTLPNLEQGHAHVWSPVFLKVSAVFHIAKKRTADVSSTPKVGERSVAPKALSPVDVERINEAMAETVEQAKANDPRELKKKIAELERRLREQQSAKPAEPKVERVEVPIVKPEQIEALRTLAGELGVYSSSVKLSLDTFTNALDLVAAARHIPVKPSPAPKSAAAAPAARVSEQPRRADKISGTTPRENSDVPRAWQILLDGLAWYAAVGLAQVTRNQLAAFVGQAAEGGAFQNKLGAMRTAGLVEYPGGGLVGLTDAGRRAANWPESDPTRAQLHDAVRGFLPPAQWKLLKLLIDIYPDSCSREELAEAAGEAASGGAFQNKLGRLRTLGFVEYPRQGFVAATDLLFPEGLS
jgi:uncharacterized protein